VRFLLRTHGCRANQYDSEIVRGMLLASGGVETAEAEEADFAIVNSCSVTASAEAKLRKDIRHIARKNPAVRTIVIGCAPGLARRDESAVPLRTLPTVTDALAGADLELIAATLGLSRDLARTPRGLQTGARALLRIQDGCDEHCTFCATTIARGENRSRPREDLIAEALVLAGTHPEIVLTGIHIGSYGADVDSSLSSLVEALIAAVPGVRFRLSSIEATEVDDRLRELLSDGSRLVPYLHAPLQSGSDRVLKRMGRSWYTARKYRHAVDGIVAGRSVFGLGADIICGFPGETEEDHRQTVDLVESLPFTSLHVFPYSARPGTASVRLSHQVGSPKIERRSAELRALAIQKSAVYRASRVGGRAEIVVTEPGSGLTEDYLSVVIPDPAVRRRDRFEAMLVERNGRLSAEPIITTRE
jgi:threonylcarbamoyladenosine tRNA methylthiotransferase MtaB